MLIDNADQRAVESIPPYLRALRMDPSPGGGARIRPGRGHVTSSASQPAGRRNEKSHPEVPGWLSLRIG